MVGEIQPHKTGIMMNNISTTNLTRAKKRWRRAFFAISFANTVAKNVISKEPDSKFLKYSIVEFIRQVVVPKISINIKEMFDHHFNSNDQRQLIKSDGVDSGLDHGIAGRDLNKIRLVFGSNTYDIPTPVGLFYLVIQHPFKDEKIPTPQIVVPKVGIDIVELSDRQLYNIDQTLLSDIVRNKDMKKFRGFDGVKGLARTLDTDLENGINDQDLSNRRNVFGSNTYQRQPRKSFLDFVAEGFSDTMFRILMVCAALSLGFSIRKDGFKDGWYEGGNILLTVFLVIVVFAVSEFRQNTQLDNLRNIRNDIKIDVIREGRRQKISIFDIVVGDVAVLNVGDQIPADGLFIDGHSLLVDESSMTGESRYIEVNQISNPFLLSGAYVVDGHCRMLVLSVGINTEWGLMMSSIADDYNEQTPLQSRLEKLTTSVGIMSLVVAFLVLLVMLIRYFTENREDENGNQEYNGKHTSVYEILDSVLGILMAAVAILVLAIPEGLPLAVNFIHAYSIKRMIGDQAMVRRLYAYETMSSTTVICTNKTGALTMNKMTITKFWLGLEYMEPHSSNVISPEVLELLHEGVGFNTTGTIFKNASRLVPEYSGSPTEKGILSWAVEELGMDMEKLIETLTVLHVKTFSSEIKRSGVSIRRKNDNTTHVHWKGAAEIILALCSKYYSKNGCEMLIDSGSKTQLKNIIEGMAAGGLRCIAFAHKKVLDGTNYQTLTEEGLTLLGIVGLKDPCRPGSKTAIETCRFAGVQIKMITGDNVFTAKAIATECGILEPGRNVCEEEVVEGVQFRNFTDEERMQKVDKIRVMARSSPFDKLLMVKCLKQKGHVVVVTGDGTNDVPALKEADIGLSMGIQGTEVAKQSSDIVILDDSIASVANVLMWGRCVYNNIQKLVQFYLTIIASALVINFVAAVTSCGVPITAVQLLWVNIIMDALGPLALATEGPTMELLKKPPVGRFEPVITNIMWRNMLVQAIFQITVLLTFEFKGKAILNVDGRVKNTIIFNTFVLCQVFNEFNLRKLEKRNVFKGISKNKLFVGIIGITIVLQIVMVEFLKNFADTERLNGKQWGICVATAALSWPIGWLMKLIPVPGKPFLSYIRD